MVGRFIVRGDIKKEKTVLFVDSSDPGQESGVFLRLLPVESVRPALEHSLLRVLERREDRGAQDLLDYRQDDHPEVRQQRVPRTDQVQDTHHSRDESRHG